jgi:uncharacterized membrane protein YsdA (DUF1294 family)
MRNARFTGFNWIKYIVILICCISLILLSDVSEASKVVIQQTILKEAGTVSDTVTQPLETGKAAINKDSLSSAANKTDSHIISEPVASVASNGPGPLINKLILKLLGDNSFFELKKNLLDYGDHYLHPGLLKTYALIIENTYTYPIIFVFIFIILLFIVNANLILFFLYFINKLKNRQERYVTIYRRSYEEVLQSYLFGEIGWDRALAKFKKMKNPRNRNMLTALLLVYKENLRGEMDSQIPEIYFKLNLHQDSMKLAKSWVYYKKVQGIKELTNLYPEGAISIIQKNLNDKNNLVRTESQISYVRLHAENPFDFLKSLSSTFTRWTQLSAFHIFRLHQLPVPSFVEYIGSKNDNVRNFSLRMIIFFQQVENASEIINLLSSKDEMTRCLAIKAINDLRLFEGRKWIKDIYFKETKSNKIEIIKALRNIGTEEDFKFLEYIIGSGSVTQKTEACRSMYFMSAAGRERVIAYSQEADSYSNIDQYLAHIADLRN